MNPSITIVTAFFDIGRGALPKEKHGVVLPEHLHRGVEEYFSYFKNLAKLKNPMIIYTTKDFKERVEQIRFSHGNLEKTVVVVLDSYISDSSYDFKTKTEEIMNSESFISNVVSPEFIEYWHSGYVLVNFFKSFYISDAIKKGYVNTDTAAWIDFGYCRDSEEDLSFNWFYDFSPEKIHLFNIRDIDYNRKIDEVVYTGDVYVQGGQIVAGVKMWPHLKNLMMESFQELTSNNLIDDDQTMLFMSYLKDSDSFVLRYNNPTDWFRIFKDYNTI